MTDVIFDKIEEETEWSLYLSMLSNPLMINDDMKSFDSFRKSIIDPDSAPAGEEAEDGLSEQQLQESVAQAESILGGFVPHV